MAAKKPPLKVVKNEQQETSEEIDGVKYATPRTAEILARNWTDGILRCRSGLFNHEFQPYTAQLNPKLKYIYVVLRCKSCTTKKHYELRLNGSRIGDAWYTYPPGYLSEGSGRIVGEAKDAVRKEAVGRLLSVAKMTAKEYNDDQPRPATVEVLRGGGN